MRFALSTSLILFAAPAFAFEPGTHGEPTEETGYFVACNTGEGGSACEIHARGAVFMAYSEGSSEPQAMDALAELPQGAPIKFTADMISMGDVTVEMALNTVAPYPDDPNAALVQGLQGTWSKDGKDIVITGLEWLEPEVADYLISLGSACSDGVELGAMHLSLYQMGGDPFSSICLELVEQTDVKVTLRDVATGTEVLLTR